MKLNYFFTVLFLALSSCQIPSRSSKRNSTDAYMTTASGLKYAILKKGRGAPAKEGQEVLIFETTSYLDGTVLYSNEDTATPVKVLIGGHQATEGMDEGLRGMKEGEVRQLIAAPYLVKRTTYPKNVSPDSTLVIKVILHQIL